MADAFVPGVGGKGRNIGGVQLSGSKTGTGNTQSFARPNDGNAYQAGDVIANDTSAATILTFPVGVAGQEWMLTGYELLIKKAATNLAIPSGMTTFKLRLYNAAPTMINDNAAWSCPVADADKYKYCLQMGQPVDIGDVLFIDDTGINKQITLVDGNLYGMLVTDGAYTPTAQVVKEVSLHGFAI